MNKTELIAAIADKANITKKDAGEALDALLGFGTFETRHRAARKGKNPQTGAEVNIPAANVPAFKAGKALKEAVK